MSKISSAFENGTAFIGFLTAGDPTIDKTVEYILAMEEVGCDLVEIGIPFSDPMAEGVVIQDANVRALKHNTTTDDVFDIVARVREKTDIPLVFLTYINPVFFYGYERFFKRCAELGIDGIISPDLPYEEKGELGVTGMRSEIKTDLNAILSDIREVTDLPLAVGFGINTPEQATEIGKIADGVIVGSAIVKIIEQYGEDAAEPLKEYVSSMKKASNE